MSESSLNSLVSLVLECKEGSKPHPEGVYGGLCVDLVDLGMVEDDWNGQRKLVRKLRLLFETDFRDEAGKAGLIAKTFTASLHQKSKLAGFLGTWRGRPVVPGDSVDLAKLLGASCTLVISHRQNAVGRTYAAIDAVSKPTKKVAPSGQYDPAETRRRIAEWKIRDAAGLAAGNPNPETRNPIPRAAAGPLNPVAAAFPQPAAAAPLVPKSGAPLAALAATADFDPEVGF
jgi:hypothetical protein